MHMFKISLSLLILRLSIAAFFGVWSSLKFFRPEWFENVFRNVYGLEFASRDAAWMIGVVQMVLVLAFALGAWRLFSYAAVGLMQAAGVIGSIPSLMNFTQYPNNLMWAAVPALAAVVVLFVLRDLDRFSLDGWRAMRAAEI